MDENAKSTLRVPLPMDEVVSLGHGEMMNLFFEDMPIPKGVIIYATLNQLAKDLEKRLEDFKPHLKQHAQDNGTKNAQGGFEVLMDSQSGAVYDGTKIIKERRRATEPDSDKLLALLKSKGIPVKEAFVEVKKLELSPTMLNHLVDTGKLTADDVEELHGITWACKVEPGPALKAVIKSALRPPTKKKVVSGEKTVAKASQKAAR